MKHLALDYFFVQEKVHSNDLQVLYISTKLQLADALTKELPKESFLEIINKTSVLKSSPTLRGSVE